MIPNFIQYSDDYVKLMFKPPKRENPRDFRLQEVQNLSTKPYARRLSNLLPVPYSRLYDTEVVDNTVFSFSFNKASKSYRQQ